MGARGVSESILPNETAHQRLRVSLVAGSLYDAVFGVILLAAPGFGSWFLDIPLPAQQVYLRFIGVFLFLLALLYMLPVIHPGAYLGNVVVAIVGRAAGAVFLFTATLAYAQPRAFLLLGGADLLFSVLHYHFLRQAAGGNPLRHYAE